MKGLFWSWRIWWGLVKHTLRIIEMIICHWLNLIIIIITVLVFKWICFMLVMVGGVSSPIRLFDIDEVIGLTYFMRPWNFFDLVRKKLKNSQNRQKSYLDVRRTELEFEDNEKINLKISPMKDVIHFGKKENLNPHYLAPYKILKYIGEVAYELNLSSELTLIHSMFYEFLLKKYTCDPTLILLLESVGVKESLSYEDVIVEILGHQAWKLKNKEVASVQVL